MSSVIVKNLVKEYVLKTSFIKQLTGKADVVKAVSDISFTIDDGEIVGLVGESGCGKTTLGKMLVKIEEATSGNIIIDNTDITNLKSQDNEAFRKKVQFIFQDPFDSLDPKMTIYEILAEPLKNLKLVNSKEEMNRLIENILRQVELTPTEHYINRYPHNLSGGQRQRVAIARGLIVKPEFIVADEPVSMLDVSIRAGILNLLQKLNKDTNVGVLLITHDLATARFLCNRIIVMYLGKIMEITGPKELVKNPKHPYTRLLLSSAPDLFADKKERLEVIGEAATATAPPKGCRFSPRCKKATELCREREPELRDISGHKIWCHLYD